MTDTIDIPTELLQLIFGFLDKDPFSLYSVLRVSRKWFDSCLPVLWRKTKFRHLYRIQARRRHIYSLNVRDTIVKANKRVYCCPIPGITRLNVVKLVLAKYNRNPRLGIQYFRPLMQEPLDHLVLRDSCLDSTLAKHVASACTGLRSISIYRCDIGPNFSLMELLNELKSLEDVGIDFCDHQVATKEVLEHLASLKCLKRLNIGKLAHPDVLAGILQDDSSQFSALEHLSLHLPAKIVFPLARKIPRARDLRLTIYGQCDNIFLNISRLIELRQLYIWLEKFPACGDEIMPLTALTNLESLHIESRDLYLVNRDSTDPRRLFPYFPQPNPFGFVPDCNLYTPVLASLATSCRWISTIRLPIMVDLLQLLPEPDTENFTPRFPRLRRLDVLGFKPQGPTINDL